MRKNNEICCGVVESGNSQQTSPGLSKRRDFWRNPLPLSFNAKLLKISMNEWACE